MDLHGIDQQTIIISLLSGIAGFLLKRERQLGSIEAKLERLIRDVDGIALFVQTPRAIATQQEKENKLKEVKNDSNS